MLAAIVAYIVLRVWARITVVSAFFDSLGMGGAYSTGLRASWLLAAAGLLGAAALAAPIGIVLGRRVGLLPMRRIGWGVGAAVFAIATSVLVPSLLGQRDAILAQAHAVPFGQTDPVFGRDVSFFVFTAPLAGDLAGLALGVLIVALLAVGAVAGVTLSVDGPAVVRRRLLSRTGTLAAVYGGLALVALAVLVWFRRYDTVHRGDELIAGAGRAMRDVGIPTTTVIAGAIVAAGVATTALAIPAVRRRLAGTPTITIVRAAAAGLGAVVVALVLLASVWWLVLALALAPLVVVVRPGGALTRALSRQAAQALGANEAPFRIPAWGYGVTLGVVSLLALALAPIGTALYDAVGLRGSTLQVERANIEATLKATRRAAGLEGVETSEAFYRRGGVSRAAIEAAPASVGSLRFLDLEAALAACRRLQALNRFYTCQDADIDRYVRDGTPQTLFVFGREVDYDAIDDFQRRHFSFTHGRGIAMAPVNRIDDSGRPSFVVGGLPTVRGLDQPLTRPEIYHGAEPGMPYAIVNTDQPDGFTNRPAEPWSGAGIDVDSNKLALTVELGGLPFVGGGRQLWNALARVDTADSAALLYRDLSSRLDRLAPFLRVDDDPWFVAEGGRLYVMQNAYTRTDRYPYAAHFDGAAYQRHSVTAVMDAYSGETKLYVMDDEDPLIATWRAVYPQLFSDRGDIPAGIAAHLRYGEGQFDYQAAALERFHVTDTDRFFSNDDAWAPTVETTGRGTEGQRIVSPARYSYAVLPGESEERFLLLRYFKPATQGRGIAFSAWLTAESDPARFGRLRLLRFDVAEDALDSVDTFVASVARDSQLSADIGLRRDQVLRGNTIVVPIGQGLLYVQPLYLDTTSDSLPTLWQVVVSLGDGRIYSGPSFPEALERALGAQGDGRGPTDPSAPPADIRQLVSQAAAAYEAYRTAWAAGDYEAAARSLREFERLLAAAQKRAQEGGPG